METLTAMATVETTNNFLFPSKIIEFGFVATLEGKYVTHQLDVMFVFFFFLLG
jgi:hypothetical protein